MVPSCLNLIWQQQITYLDILFTFVDLKKIRVFHKCIDVVLWDVV